MPVRVPHRSNLVLAALILALCAISVPIGARATSTARPSSTPGQTIGAATRPTARLARSDGSCFAFQAIS